jgi:hypothetical protein
MHNWCGFQPIFRIVQKKTKRKLCWISLYFTSILGAAR